jgi:hypothetical protein
MNRLQIVASSALLFFACGPGPDQTGTGGGDATGGGSTGGGFVTGGGTTATGGGAATGGGVATGGGSATGGGVATGGGTATGGGAATGGGSACTPTHWYQDHDGDGFGALAVVQDACTKPSGYVADHTDCDDTRATVHPQAVELCNGLDDDCDGLVDGTPAQAAACAAANGSYDGGFRLYTAEKLGSSVINEMTCVGTDAFTVDLTATPVLSGNVTCTYGGGLTAFDHTQHGTVTGSLAVTGAVKLSLVYGFSSSASDSRTFSVTGALDGGTLTATGTGSWSPNPQSAVPWSVDISLAGTHH